MHLMNATSTGFDLAMESIGVRDALRILVVAALWGGSFLFIRVAVPALSPLPLMAVRTGLAGTVLLAFVSIVRHGPTVRDTGRYLTLGLTSAAAPFALIAFAELYLPASLAAILNATTPLFTALLTAAVTRTAPTPRRLLGILIGVVGVTIVVGIGPVAVTPTVLLAVAASLSAAIFYAIGGVYAQRRMADLKPLTVATGQNLGATALLLLPALLTRPTMAPSGTAWANAIALGLLSSAVGYAIFYQLVTTVGATAALSVTFLVPVFGLLWGALFLRETITLSLVLGLAVILTGLYLLLGPQRSPARSALASRDSASR